MTPLQTVSTIGAGSAALAAGSYGISMATKESWETDEEDVLNKAKQISKDEKLMDQEQEEGSKEVKVYGTIDDLDLPYKDRLLDLTKKEHLNYLVKSLDISNEWWWVNTYEEIYKPNRHNVEIDDLFLHVEEGFDLNENSESLNQACDKAYKKTKDQYSFNDKNYLLKNIGQFCTKQEIDITEPKVETYESNDSIGDDYNKGLLSIPDNRPFIVKKQNNDLWWNWAFTKLYKTNKESKHSVFLRLNSPTGDTNTSLSKACDDSYKRETKDLVPEITVNHHIFNNIKRFCTPGTGLANLGFPNWAEPTTKATLESTTTTGIGSITGNQTKLVHSKNTTNQDWWNWAFHTRFPKDQESRDQLPSPFNTVIFGFSSSPGNTKSLSQMCVTSYSKPLAELKQTSYYKNKTLLDLIKEFCLSNPQDNTLQLPNN